MTKAYPQKSKYGIPHFDSFACIGDSVSWVPSRGNPAGLKLTATLVDYVVSTPADFECYSKKKVKEWQNGLWRYVGVVLSVSRNGITLDDHAASLWGIECNYNARSNLHFAQLCKDLEHEALEMGNEVMAKLIGG